MIVHDIVLAALVLTFYATVLDFIIRPPRGGDTR